MSSLMHLDIEIYKLFIKRQAQFVVKVMKPSGKLKMYSKKLEEKFDLPICILFCF